MAKTVSASRAHHTTKEAALGKLSGLASALESRYGVTVRLAGDGATVTGKGVSGGCSVDDTTVRIDLTLRMPASLVAGRIQTGVEKALAEHFG